MASLLRVMKTFHLLLIPRLWNQNNGKPISSKSWGGKKDWKMFLKKRLRKMFEWQSLVVHLQTLLKPEARHISRNSHVLLLQRLHGAPQQGWCALLPMSDPREVTWLWSGAIKTPFQYTWEHCILQLQSQVHHQSSDSWFWHWSPGPSNKLFTFCADLKNCRPEMGKKIKQLLSSGMALHWKSIQERKW